MSKEAQSPKQDELSRGNDEVYHTTIPLAAVEAMCRDNNMSQLLQSPVPRKTIMDIYEAEIINTPDWVIAGMNCVKNSEILPIAIHTFLLDWKPS